MMTATGAELLTGVIDLHVHGYPELRPQSGKTLDDVEMTKRAAARGVSGFVLKSHLWPTIDRVFHIRRHNIDSIEVIPSIVLNSLVGGISPGVLEAAVLQGVGAFFFPTWSAANDIKRNGFSRRIRQELPSLKCYLDEGLSVLDTNGVLTGDARDVLRVAKDNGIAACTGHLSGAEALALSDFANQIDFQKLVFTHPDSNSVGATEAEILEAAKRGAFIEWTFTGLLPISQRLHPQRIVDWIETIGPGSCVLSTDTFGRASLPEPDLFELFLLTLSELGVSDEDLRMMSTHNPRMLLAGALDPASDRLRSTADSAIPET